MSSSKVILINPPTTDPGQRRLYFPMALLTLGGVLKKMGIPTELWDFDFFVKKVGNLTEDEFRKVIRSGVDAVRNPVFGVSAICSNLPMALWMAKEIKARRPDALIIFGGSQPSSVPTQILERFPFVDVVAIGEGEVTLEEMARVDFDRARLSDIPGLAFRIGQTVTATPKRSLVPNMDDLPLPDYSLINFRDYQAMKLDDFKPHVEVGRGCPYSCTFCSTTLMWEKDFRVKSPARILQEMESLHRAYGIDEFDFIHDNFTTSKKFVQEFCEFMQEKNVSSLKWHVSSRTDCMDVPRLERMYRVGLRGLFFGVETGSERMQKVIRKGLRFDHFEPIIMKANELGIGSTTAFIMGFPEEGADDLDQTVYRALHYKALGTPRVYFSKLTALTGTSLYRDFVKRLEQLTDVSSFSPQNYGLPFVRRIIRENPDLFSSFYHIPHPEFSESYLSRFIEFAHLLVNGDTKITLQLIECLEFSPTRLFALWDNWAELKMIPYANYRIYSYQQFHDDFQMFLNEVIFAARNQPVRKGTLSSSLAMSPNFS